MNAGDKDTYLTLEGPCEGLFKAKGSKHFGYGFPVHSEAEVKGHLEAIRKSHHAARHVAFAWMIGFNGDHFRSCDDGDGESRSRTCSLYISMYVRPNVHENSSSFLAKSKSSCTAIGITPGLPSSPIMVNVLPEPVAPYAKHEPWKPRPTAWTTGLTPVAYRSADELPGPKAKSNL